MVIMGSTAIGPAFVTSHIFVTRHTAVYVSEILLFDKSGTYDTYSAVLMTGPLEKNYLNTSVMVPIKSLPKNRIL